MDSLLNFAETSALIKSGEKLLLSGDKNILDKLPGGSWVAGTTPYFIGMEGGLKTNENIFVTKFPSNILDFKIIEYNEDQLSQIPRDYYPNGFSYIIIAPFSKVHTLFAENCSTYKGLFDSPLIGWIAGFDLDKSIDKKGYVYNGTSSKAYNDKAIVIHFSLEKNKKASLDIINLFTQGNGDIICFNQKGFLIEECFINGEIQNFAKYLLEKEVNLELPLVSDYLGLKANVSFKKIDVEKGTVELYAPVFLDTEYQIAAPIGIYEDEFSDEIKKRLVNPFFSFNCILNYQYAKLEGKKTANIHGPVTFGEIGHILLNQTMVYLSIEEI